MQSSNLQIQQALSGLLQDEPVRAVVDTDIIYPDINKNPDALYSFLLATGYLKIADIIGEIGNDPVCRLLIPNKEIKAVFKKEIIDHISVNFTSSVATDFQLAIQSGDGPAIEATLQAFLIQAASSFDTSAENFYHGLMLGLLAMMSDQYFIRSNREAGTGRYDLQLEPRQKDLPGMILEFKSKKNCTEKQLTELAKTALSQIKDHAYTTDLSERGITEIVLYGIAFSGKQVAVEMETF